MSAMVYTILPSTPSGQRNSLY